MVQHSEHQSFSKFFGLSGYRIFNIFLDDFRMHFGIILADSFDHFSILFQYRFSACFLTTFFMDLGSNWCSTGSQNCSEIHYFFLLLCLLGSILEHPCSRWLRFVSILVHFWIHFGSFWIILAPFPIENHPFWHPSSSEEFFRWRSDRARASSNNLENQGPASSGILP